MIKKNRTPQRTGTCTLPVTPRVSFVAQSFIYFLPCSVTLKNSLVIFVSAAHERCRFFLDVFNIESNRINYLKRFG